MQLLPEKDEHLLSPYLHNMDVNERKCMVLLRRALENDFTGGYVYLRDALGDTVKFPVVEVTAKGSFGEVQMFAAVFGDVLPK